LDFLVVGLNHRTAPIEVREKLAVPKTQLPDALKAMNDSFGGGVLLCTCNRSEIYTQGTDPDIDESVEEFLTDHFGVSITEIERYLYSYRAVDCVHHLFRVASGLDSMILGEGEILGQVRDAFGASVQSDAVQQPLSRLFHQALRVGKKVRTQTGISRNALSISRVCVDLARNLRSDLSQLKVMVVGAGEAGELAARALKNSGVEEVSVANRTFQRGVELAEALSGHAIAFEMIPEALKDVDIIITSTDAPGYVIDAQMVYEAMADRPDRPLYLIDIAVPRDVDPECALFNNVLVYDVDDLRNISDSNRLEKEQEAAKAEEIVSDEVRRFDKALNTLQTVPTITSIRRMAEDIRAGELEKLTRRMDPSLSPSDVRDMEAMTRAIVNKLLHAPTRYLRYTADPERVRTVRDVFGVDFLSEENPPEDA
jgi:glutamyl-tRNA reductase